MELSKFISATIDKLNRRIVKVLRFGLNDVQTNYSIAPYGDDSNPIAGMIALYSKTSSKKDTVIIGYINKNQLAQVGEKRLFSTDKDGNEKFFVWLKNDGTMQIGGDSNYAVKFNELKAEFNKLQNDFNNHLTEYDSHTHAGVTVGSGATSITTPSTYTNSSNIDNAKNDKILTI